MWSIVLTALLLCTLNVTSAAEFTRLSSAELQVGIATPAGFTTHNDVESERVAPGSLGTTLMFSGYFPLGSWFSLSPGFVLLTTDGRVTNDPSPPTAFDIRYTQSEAALDALITPGGLRRLQLGLGTSFTWWNAAEDNARVSYEDERTYERGRRIDSKAVMARGVIHLALRNPEVSGASLKLVGAFPVNDLLSLDNTAASGYIGLQCGFAMILN